jgi:hypothetical protein
MFVPLVMLFFELLEFWTFVRPSQYSPLVTTQLSIAPNVLHSSFVDGPHLSLFLFATTTIYPSIQLQLDI